MVHGESVNKFRNAPMVRICFVAFPMLGVEFQQFLSFGFIY